MNLLLKQLVMKESQEIHDYRVINIELDLYGDTFELLASEIILSKLQEFFFDEKFDKLQQYNKNYLSDEVLYF